MATKEQEQQTVEQQKQQPKNFSWRRWSIVVALIALLAAGIIWLYSIGGHSQGVWVTILAALFATFGVAISFLQWRFPLSSNETKIQNNSSRSDKITNTLVRTSPAPTITINNLIAIPKHKPLEAVFQPKTPLTDLSDFFGREAVTKKLLSRIQKKASTSIVGPGSIGKTWLLQYLRLVAPIELGSRYRIGYLDTYLPSCRTVEGFTETALAEFDMPTVSHTGSLSLIDLEKAIRDLNRKSVIPVLCIDNFERFNNSKALREFDSSFFSGLRALTYDGLVLITASRVPLFDIVVETVGARGLTSPFSNIFTQLTLEPFSEREAYEFVRAKAHRAGFTEQEQECLLRYGRDDNNQWPPLMLQLAGEMILEDKTMASEREHLHHLDDEKYWQRFTEDLKEAYYGKA